MKYGRKSMKYGRKSMKYGRKSMKYGRKSVRTKHKTRKNKSRMMKRGGAMTNERIPAPSTETIGELKDKIADLKSNLIFTRETRKGFKEQRDGCLIEEELLKKENEILENENGGLEIKISELKEKLESEIIKVGKVGGATSGRSPLLRTKTRAELKKQIKDSVNDKVEVKKERDNFRGDRDICYLALNRLKEQNKILNKNNKNLNREFTRLKKKKKIKDNSVVKTNLSALNISINDPPPNRFNPDNMFNREFNLKKGMTSEEKEKMGSNINTAIKMALDRSSQLANIRREAESAYRIYNYKI